MRMEQLNEKISKLKERLKRVQEKMKKSTACLLVAPPSEIEKQILERSLLQAEEQQILALIDILAHHTNLKQLR